MIWDKYNKFFCLLVLALLHFGLGFYSYQVSIKTHDTDFYHYYEKLQNDTESSVFSIGSSFFIQINSIFRNFSFFTISFLYSIISFIPFYWIYKSLSKSLISVQSSLFLKITIGFLLFLPSVHFWLATFSKDSLCFFLICFIICNFSKKWKNNTLKIFTITASCILLFLIRPYLILILLSSYAVVYRKFYNRNFLISSAITVGFLIFIFIKYFLGVKEFNINYLTNFFTNFMEYSATGNASINLNDTTIFSRFFIMMFRPLFYDARDIYQIVISIENLALIFWFSFALIQSIKRGYHHIFKVSKVALFFGVAGLLLWVFYSTYIYNLGLASRMKATIIPLLFICFQDFFAKTIKKSNFVDID